MGKIIDFLRQALGIKTNAEKMCEIAQTVYEEVVPVLAPYQNIIEDKMKLDDEECEKIITTLYELKSLVIKWWKIKKRISNWNDLPALSNETTVNMMISAVKYTNALSNIAFGEVWEIMSKIVEDEVVEKKLHLELPIKADDREFTPCVVIS